MGPDRHMPLDYSKQIHYAKISGVPVEMEKLSL